MLVAFLCMISFLSRPFERIRIVKRPLVAVSKTVDCTVFLLSLFVLTAQWMSWACDYVFFFCCCCCCNVICFTRNYFCIQVWVGEHSPGHSPLEFLCKQNNSTGIELAFCRLDEQVFFLFHCIFGITEAGLLDHVTCSSCLEKKILKGIEIARASAKLWVMFFV